VLVLTFKLLFNANNSAIVTCEFFFSNFLYMKANQVTCAVI